MSSLKLAAALSPLIAAVLATLGMEVADVEIEKWAMWGVALISMAAPSVKAWFKHRALAD